MIGLAKTGADHLPGSSFLQWAELWSGLGLWLSLWDERGNCVEQAGTGERFWNALAQHSKQYRNRLQQTARAAPQTGPVTTELDPGSGLVVIAVPVTRGRRVVGSLLACGLSPEFSDQEVLARFCDLHEFDRLLCAGLAADTPRHGLETLRAYAAILRHQVDSWSAGALARWDIEGLSAELAQAYEELNLIYRVSADMTVSKRPVAYFEKLGAELLAATVVESLATVLEPPPRVTAESAVVMTGPLEAGREEVLRLYDQAHHHGRNAGASLVVNDAAASPEFSWAAHWLQRFVFFELSRNEQRFGGILAVNRSDGQDFGSEEIQLINSMAQRSAAFLENVRLYDDLEQLFMGMLHALVSSIDAKDPYTCGHSQRVAWLSRHIAGLAGVPDGLSQRVYLGGLLHDIGKIGVSESVLGKTGRLTPAEFEEMKRHPEIGARILESVPQVGDLIPSVLHHHERVDGRGYPAGLAGEDVPFLGRIVCLADSVDAMTTSRTYREARTLPWAAAEIRRCSGSQFDPALADLLLQDDLEGVVRKMARSGRRGPMRA